MSRQVRPFKILVVEDSPADAELISHGFAESGENCDLKIVSTLRAGQEALKHEEFDMLISDMGVTNGETIDFLKWARAQTNGKMPVIVLSGFSDPNPSYEAGANAFISKPGDVERFFEKIRALMHFWVQIAELPRR